MPDPLAIPVLEPSAPAGAAVDLRARLAPIRDALAALPFVTVALNDPQRQTASLAVLAALAPLPPVRIVVACGTHRFAPAQRTPLEQALRPAANVQSIRWHDGLADDLVPLNGWRVNPALLDGAGPLLAIGSVEPHYFAGLTGAHKTCTIGCSDPDAIEANHAGALSPDSGLLRLAGNPVHEGIAAMLAGLAARRPVLAVNLVQLAEAVHAVAVGEPLATLDELAPVVRGLYCHRLPEPADALVLDVQGPLGQSFYQADKAIKNSEHAVRDGGLLVLHAPCPDGIGQDHFVRLLRAGPDARAARALVQRQGYRLGDHKALRLRALTDPAGRAVRVVAVSAGLSHDDCAVLGFARAPTVADALAGAAIDPARHRVYRVADAANTVVHAPAHRPNRD